MGVVTSVYGSCKESTDRELQARISRCFDKKNGAVALRASVPPTPLCASLLRNRYRVAIFTIVPEPPSAPNQVWYVPCKMSPERPPLRCHAIVVSSVSTCFKYAWVDSDKSCERGIGGVEVGGGARHRGGGTMRQLRQRKAGRWRAVLRRKTKREHALARARSNTCSTQGLGRDHLITLTLESPTLITPALRCVYNPPPPVIRD